MVTRRGGWQALAAALAVPVLIWVAIGVQSIVEVRVLTVDPTTQAELPPWTGAMSTAGILMWCIGATSGITTGLRRSRTASGARDARAACALAFGLLAAWLCVDDAFLVHDSIAPRYLGVSELAVIGVEAAWLLVLLVKHQRVVLEEEPLLFAAALVGFGVSVIGDALPVKSDVPGLWRMSTYIVEDGFKWLGICAFTTWLVRVCRNQRPIETHEEHP